MRASDLDPRRALRIVVVYLVAAGAWILATGVIVDPVADALGIAPGALEIGKGLAFVAFTAAVLYVALRGWAGRLQHAARAEAAAADRMRCAEEMRTAFLSNVSHELRTPLTAIVGYSLTIEQHGERFDREQLEQLAGRLVSNADRLRRLVDDLLEVDELMHGIGHLRTEPADLAELARRVIDASDLGDRRVETSGSPTTAVVDVAKVERCLRHLLHNVVKHTGEDTRVNVTIVRDGQRVRLVVEDDGCGLPDALIGQLFDPFIQGDGAARGPSPGIGIGLTLVARFVGLHDGSVVAENGPDGGARFTIELPVGADPTAVSAEQSAFA